MGCLFGATLAHKAGVRVSLLTRHPPPFPRATIHVRESYRLRAPSPSLPPRPPSASPSTSSSNANSSSSSSSYTAHVFLEANEEGREGGREGRISSSNSSKISHLFVLTKAYDIKKALKNIAPRLGKETVVLLLSNGMGCVEEAQEALREGGKSSSSSSSSSKGGEEGGREGGREEGPVWVVGTITHGALKVERRWEEGGEEGKEGELHMASSSSSSSSSSDESVHFYVEHTGLGQTFLGLPLLPSSSSAPSPTPSLPPSLPPSLLSHLTLAGLSPVFEHPREMRKRLWLKLGVNVVINPLTALLNCRNGEILEDMPSLPPSLLSSSLRGLVRELCEETAAVAAAVEREEQNTTTFPSSSTPSSLPSSSMPTAEELQVVKNQENTTTPSSLPSSLPPSSMPTADELELFTVQVAKATAGNQSSMLRDLIREGGREGGKEGGKEGGREGRRRRRTEIEYLNGFIVREGRRLGVSVSRHEVLTELVRTREREGGREGGREGVRGEGGGSV